MKSRINLLSYDTIVAATSGDISAIKEVLKKYERYITVLATRRFYDEEGSLYFRVDEELKNCLEAKLIAKILIFRPV